MRGVEVFIDDHRFAVRIFRPFHIAEREQSVAFVPVRLFHILPALRFQRCICQIDHITKTADFLIRRVDAVLIPQHARRQTKRPRLVKRLRSRLIILLFTRQFAQSCEACSQIEPRKHIIWVFFDPFVVVGGDVAPHAEIVEHILAEQAVYFRFLVRAIDDDEAVVEMLPILLNIFITVDAASAVEGAEIAVLAVKLLFVVIVAVDGEIMSPPAAVGQVVPFFNDDGVASVDEPLEQIKIAATAGDGFLGIGVFVDVIGNLPWADVAIFGVGFEVAGDDFLIDGRACDVKYGTLRAV